MGADPVQESRGDDALVPSGVPALGQPKDAILPSANQPWRDTSLGPSVRLAAYKQFVGAQIEAILATVDGLAGDAAKQLEIRDAAETKLWVSEATWLRAVSAEDFCRRMDHRITPLEIGAEMVASYRFDTASGVSTFTIPAGVTEMEAMKAVN
ncbi:MAG: hypothetical protein RL518_1557, partial [Pseudomonadota bacterium]